MGYTTIRYAFVSYTLICSVRSGIEAMPSSSWCQTGGSQKTAEGKYLSYLLTCLVEEDWYVLPLRGRSYFVRIESIQIHRSISVGTIDRCILNSSWSTTQTNWHGCTFFLGLFWFCRWPSKIVENAAADNMYLWGHVHTAMICMVLAKKMSLKFVAT